MVMGSYDKLAAIKTDLPQLAIRTLMKHLLSCTLSSIWVRDGQIKKCREKIFLPSSLKRNWEKYNYPLSSFNF